jgi:hypothetical protein
LVQSQSKKLLKGKGLGKYMSNDFSKVDEMIAAAKARVSAREGGPEEGNSKMKQKIVLKDGETVGTKRAKVSDAEREARKEKLEAERAERKATRARKAAEAKAARESEQANHKPHMKKIASAAARLPALDENTQLILNEATANLSAAQLAALAAHIELHNRVQATERAVSQKVEIGDRVRIVSGNARYIGREGVVSEAKRIRCFVELEDVTNPVYLFTSDVEVLSAEEVEETVEVEATGTDG